MPRRIVMLLISTLAYAGVTRVEITQRHDLAMVNYEEIIGKLYFAVDPKLPHNQIIVDLDRAPRNAKGLVEFSADLYVLKPKDPAKSNGTALLEISNRGGKGMLGMFDLAPSGSTAPPRTAADLGDPLLFQSGYTLVCVGWEVDDPDSTH